VTDYDALDSQFASKQQAMDYRGSVRTAPWDKVTHNTLAKERNVYNQRYVRAGAAPDGSDLKTYDVGTFQLCTQGQDNTDVIGELYVEYEIELVGPKINSVPGQNLLGADILAGGTLSNGNLFGTAPTTDPGSNLTVTLNGNTVSIAPTIGRFLVTFSVYGTGLGNLSVTLAGGALIIDNVSATGVTNAGATIACYSMMIDITNALGTFAFTLSASTTLNGSQLWIQQQSSGMALSKPKIQEFVANKPHRVIARTRGQDSTAERISQLEAMLAKLTMALDAQQQGPPQLRALGGPQTGF
jgi:hypothetical protein